MTWRWIIFFLLIKSFFERLLPNFISFWTFLEKMSTIKKQKLQNIIYDASHNRNTCPHPGIYLETHIYNIFSLHLCIDTRNEVWLFLMMTKLGLHISASYHHREPFLSIFYPLKVLPPFHFTGPIPGLPFAQGILLAGWIPFGLGSFFNRVFGFCDGFLVCLISIVEQYHKLQL